MLRRKIAEGLEKSDEKTKGYIEIPLPKFPKFPKITLKSFSQSNLNVVLFLALIVAAYFLGVLTTKVQFLEKSNGANTNGPAQAALPQAPAAADPNKIYDVATGNFPIKGDANAKVTVVEFADFRCPFCEKLYTDVILQLEKDYVNTGKVKFAYRQYAFLGPASVLAGNAAECANEQNKFWDFHDYLFNNQPDESDTSMFTNEKMTEIAGSLGMDTTQFNSCITSNKYDKNVQSDLADGQKVGVNGTPTVFINGKSFVGAQPYETFKAAIEEALKS